MVRKLKIPEKNCFGFEHERNNEKGYPHAPNEAQTRDAALTFCLIRFRFLIKIDQREEYA